MFRRYAEHKFTEDDEKWYNDRIPNPITRNLAIKIHKELGWDAIRDSLVKRGSFGKSIVRNGRKKDMAYLLALDLTEATSMVAVCDEVNWGVIERPRMEKTEGEKIKHGEKLKGKSCDLYINGKYIESVDNIEGTKIKPNYRNKSVRGTERDKEIVNLGEYSQSLKRNIGEKTAEVMKGKLTLNSDEDLRVPLSLSGKKPLKLGERKFSIQGSFVLPVKEEANQEEKSTVFPCRIASYKKDDHGARMKDDISIKYRIDDPYFKDASGFRCVNWARIIDREDAKRYKFMI